MPHPRRFRFAVELHQPFAGSSWIETGRQVEELGYSTAFFPDHFDEGPGPLSTMAAVAVADIKTADEARAVTAAWNGAGEDGPCGGAIGVLCAAGGVIGQSKKQASTCVG